MSIWRVIPVYQENEKAGYRICREKASGAIEWGSTVHKRKIDASVECERLNENERRKHEAAVFREDKVKITEAMEAFLKQTRAGCDIVSLEYVRHSGYDEIIRIEWLDGSIQPVNVTADSGIAMLKDVLHAIS